MAEVNEKAAVEALAKFEFERLERESDLKVNGEPKEWEDCEPALREEMLTWARHALGAVADATGQEEPPQWPRSEWDVMMRFITDNDKLFTQEIVPRNVHEWDQEHLAKAIEIGVVRRGEVNFEVMSGGKVE